MPSQEWAYVIFLLTFVVVVVVVVFVVVCSIYLDIMMPGWGTNWLYVLLLTIPAISHVSATASHTGIVPIMKSVSIKYCLKYSVLASVEFGQIRSNTVIPVLRFPFPSYINYFATRTCSSFSMSGSYSTHWLPFVGSRHAI